MEFCLPLPQTFLLCIAMKCQCCIVARYFEAYVPQPMHKLINLRQLTTFTTCSGIIEHTKVYRLSLSWCSAGQANWDFEQMDWQTSNTCSHLRPIAVTHLRFPSAIEAPEEHHKLHYHWVVIGKAWEGAGCYMCNCGCAALGGFASSHAIQASSVGSVGAFSGLVVGTAFCFATATLCVT